MACTVTLADIAYGCDDLGIGGIVELHVASRAAALAAITTKDDSTRVISVVSGAASDVVQFSFNLKDGFSVFSEVKTANADGTVFYCSNYLGRISKDGCCSYHCFRPNV